MNKPLVQILFILFTLLISSCNIEPREAVVRTPEVSAHPDKLVIWWAKWIPSDGLASISKEFTKLTGIEVVVHQTPWGEYQSKAFQEFSNYRTDFDILVGDSQWLGYCAERGWYVELTDYINNGGVNMDDVEPTIAQFMCKTSDGRIFAAPCEPDSMGIVYRADLFEKHGLPEPKTWDDILKAAQTIYRNEERINGWVCPTKGDGDSITMSYQNFLYAYGGSWGKVEDGNYQAMGVVNSPEAVEALTFFKQLVACGSPQFKELHYGESIEKFTNGSTAMIMTFFAYYPTIERIAREKGWKVKYINNPPRKAGEKAVASLGGQGFSISARTSLKKQHWAKQFISWFNLPETQRKWIEYPGCFTCNKTVMAAEDYKYMAPYNEAFKNSLPTLQDFWNIPVYSELLQASQKYLSEALTDKITEQEALNAIAKAHQKIFDKEMNRERAK